MKLTEIPLPAPVWVIEVRHGSDRERRAVVAALRFLLWIGPVGAVNLALAAAGHGDRPLWATLAVTFIVLAVAVLTVGPEDRGKDTL